MATTEPSVLRIDAVSCSCICFKKSLATSASRLSAGGSDAGVGGGASSGAVAWEESCAKDRAKDETTNQHAIDSEIVQSRFRDGSSMAG
jgi:hypothetical protein